MLDFSKKIISVDNEVAIKAHLSSLKAPIVFTNGCFDILHRGHVTYLQTARNLGKSLIVAINTDDSVKRQDKGTDRPINPLDDRLTLLASLECVDAVIAFNQDTPLELIKTITPDILVKGGDWKVADIVGGEHVTKNGGSIYSIPFEHDRSTTQLINRIRN
jgi:rfaE bifunctional protein nucleotidyltransferase chain/domain